MPRLKSANFAVTELKNSINDSVTSLTVNDASLFPAGGPFIILVHDNTPGYTGVKEIMEVGSINKNTNTFSNILRGRENTSAVAHGVNSRVECAWTAGTHAELEDKNSKGVAGGYASLDNTGNVPANQLGNIEIPDMKAENIEYDNTESELDAENVQDAIDEVSDDLTTHKSDVASRAINVKYPPPPLVGASGDGTTPETGVIQGIINYAPAGSSIYFPDGTFISGHLTIDKSLKIFSSPGAVLKLADNSNTHFISVLDNVSDVHFEGLTIDGNKEHNSAVAERVLLQFGNNAHGWSVQGCKIINSGRKGIGTGRGNYNFKIMLNWFRDNKDQHIAIWRDAHDFRVDHNIIMGGTHAGIQVDGDAEECYNFSLTGNIIDIGYTAYDAISLRGGVRDGVVIGNTCKNARNGIYLLLLSADLIARNITIIGNICLGNEQNGIILASSKNCTVTGNVCESNSVGINVTRTGSNPAPMDNIVTGNRCYGGQYGFIESPAGERNIFEGNNIADNTTPFTGGGVGSIIRNNIGYKTENGGTATIETGETTVEVEHGLSYTPAASDVSVTPTSSLGSASKYWISGITATKFVIAVDADPGASGATFAWNARKL